MQAKKLTALLLGAALSLGLLAGCSSGAPPPSQDLSLIHISEPT